ncbi:MAG: hypothetical protein EZS28_016075 [Streblomastix strix]|uniref:Uncharacterized protein n=1 Tax=Streblomastix strix TaxID=222440 RepID=A0A5J4W1I6_9EUKA|nr:MAG: hypothetical protein EZS28_016075 [Streblomastix strix]
MTEWQLINLSQQKRVVLDNIIDDAHVWSSQQVDQILEDNQDLDDDPDRMFTDKQLRVRAVLSQFIQQFRMKLPKANQQGKRNMIQKTAGDISEYISKQLDESQRDKSQEALKLNSQQQGGKDS